jgi:hypothetical protein
VWVHCACIQTPEFEIFVFGCLDSDYIELLPHLFPDLTQLRIASVSGVGVEHVCILLTTLTQLQHLHIDGSLSCYSLQEESGYSSVKTRNAVLVVPAQLKTFVFTIGEYDRSITEYNVEFASSSNAPSQIQHFALHSRGCITIPTGVLLTAPLLRILKLSATTLKSEALTEAMSVSNIRRLVLDDLRFTAPVDSEALRHPHKLERLELNGFRHLYAGAAPPFFTAALASYTNLRELRICGPSDFAEFAILDVIVDSPPIFNKTLRYLQLPHIIRPLLSPPPPLSPPPHFSSSTIATVDTTTAEMPSSLREPNIRCDCFNHVCICCATIKNGSNCSSRCHMFLTNPRFPSSFLFFFSSVIRHERILSLRAAKFIPPLFFSLCAKTCVKQKDTFPSVNAIDCTHVACM